jgi:hypothetical protein
MKFQVVVLWFATQRSDTVGHRRFGGTRSESSETLVSYHNPEDYYLKESFFGV